MDSEIIRNQNPEERELEKKKAELAALEEELIQRELDLATLRAELADFERRYLGIVGVLYADLDEIEAQIAEAEARRVPNDSVAEEQATRARAQARESSQSANAVVPPRPKPTENLKKLFREVAKRVHPDLAANDADRTRRQAIMAEANLAYENSDESKLRSMLADWETSPDTVQGEGVGAELVRVIRKIAQIQRRLAEIDREVNQLNSTDLYRLRVKADETKSQGRDFFREMAAQVKQQIDAAKERLVAVNTNIEL